MDQQQRKQNVADAAVAYIESDLDADSIVGVGTGSTADLFIDGLARIKNRFGATVASSEASAARLAAHGIRVLDLNDAERVTIYVDGADEVDPSRALIKGGGAALAREKIVTAASDRFVCIVDDSKLVDCLGRFPLPVEVLPMARRLVAKGLEALGGRPEHRAGVVTDNGNDIIDVHGLEIRAPDELERQINNLVGVVANGIFAANRPAVLLVGTNSGVDVRD